MQWPDSVIAFLGTPLSLSLSLADTFFVVLTLLFQPKFAANGLAPHLITGTCSANGAAVATPSTFLFPVLFLLTLPLARVMVAR